MNDKPKKSLVDKFLSSVEKIGNMLPHPATLFASFAVLVIIASWIASFFDLSVLHPGTKEEIKSFNLVSAEGLHMILSKMVTNFTNFAPLGTVLVSLLGIGIAEGSGLIGTILKKIVLSSPKKLLTFVIVFAGILSNTASEVGYVLLVPLAAIIFLAAGRHPIAGLAAAFAGVSGGYSANLLLGTIDPLLAGLSEEAARIIDPAYVVNPAANYYFLFVSTFIIAILGTWVTERIVVPRLGEYTGDEKAISIDPLTKEEKKGLIYASIAGLLFTAFILGGLIPENGYLRGTDGGILKSPFMSGIVALLFIGAALAGIAYGIGAKTIKNDTDVMKGMSKAMETLGSYIVLVFFAAQFVAYFNWTNLGLIFAIEGAETLQKSGLGAIPLMLMFIVVSALINLIMGSASAKWAIMAPVFIPMFMLLGYSPELVQVAYRIGDSVTNIISPMMSYFALIVAFMQRYDKKAGIGTIVSTMLPYTIVFFIGWSIIFVIWLLLELPLGPGAQLFYTAQ
ncbi:AbgT family transporter [Myroides odoratimimus]|uniref:Aminobenzoyl-glutamate transporter n=2 Tax=Myroides odoratimimus TaxID=76832 RepID=A0AAI8G5B8_9FLAO|nr:MULTISPECIES: AbgT family transporter [Myroides]ALU26686.1 aminobenzoyl-glutamate transporter [Myroides odoratimimus]APA92701.1 aminobenzoyl-glutamate transporter [Myroides sp. ZB35]EHO13663.1 AbgT transporter [Myroides odoratimimus CIP 101113]MDM1035050.1 AbgT family transporter [Myroides odoratimimus]MDM1037838.1 AbgT family transporter [Myroides odoratimimus]